MTLDIVVRQEAGFESGTDVPAQISFRAGGSAAPRDARALGKDAATSANSPDLA